MDKILKYMRWEHDKDHAKPPLPKIPKIIFIILFAVIFVVIWVYIKVKRDIDDTFAIDSVQVIAINVASMMAQNPNVTDAEINKLIKGLNGVTTIQIDANGNPLDMFGNRFHIQRDIVDGKVTVWCTSPGRDKKLNTSDDIIYSWRQEVIKR